MESQYVPQIVMLHIFHLSDPQTPSLIYSTEILISFKFERDQFVDIIMSCHHNLLTFCWTRSLCKILRGTFSQSSITKT